MEITYEAVKASETVRTYIERADESLQASGYTEHSFVHVTKVAETAGDILQTLGYGAREVELAKVAGYLHDIGNVVNRIDHAQSGAVMVFCLLEKMGADDGDIATIVTAIGNHDESTAFPVNPVAAALILADKTDVRYTRVRNRDFATFDIHDRVNYSVKESKVTVRKGEYIELDLTIDTKECPVVSYFEIFLERMMLCKRAAEHLQHAFRLVINGQQLM